MQGDANNATAAFAQADPAANATAAKMQGDAPKNATAAFAQADPAANATAAKMQADPAANATAAKMQGDAPKNATAAFWRVTSRVSAADNIWIYEVLPTIWVKGISFILEYLWNKENIYILAHVFIIIYDIIIYKKL